MSDLWTPSSNMVSASTGTVAFIDASNQVSGIARVLNVGGSLTFVALVSANATAGEADFVPIAAGAAFFVAFGAAANRMMVTNSTCIINAGYALKG